MEFPMSDDLTPRERELFAALPRELPHDPATEHRVVSALRAEGFFDRAAQTKWGRLAAAVALVLGGSVVGFVVGASAGARSSVEVQLARNDLTIAERVLLLQRAGSAYVQAAHAYADATAETDSTAAEVARQVLVGAAHALVRSDLGGGVAASLTSVLRTPIASQTSRPANRTPSIIWY